MLRLSVAHSQSSNRAIDQLIGVSALVRLYKRAWPTIFWLAGVQHTFADNLARFALS